MVIRPPPGFQWCQQYGIVIRDLGSTVSGVASLLGAWGYNAANIPADADLHALSNQYRNALHEVRRTDEAGPDRAARPKLRCPDLPMHALRLRGKLFESTLALGRSCLNQNPAPVVYLARETTRYSVFERSGCRFA